jgi:hypothetical protein
MTRSEWVSTLPPWRRLLATFNWRPVYDIEQKTERLRIESLESEKRLKLLQESNARIARLGQELFSSSNQAPLHRRFLAYIANELAGPPQGEQTNG